MYVSKTLLHARGQFTGRFVFIMKSVSEGGRRFVNRVYYEYGYSQDVDIKTNYKKVVELALLNAFYKINHRSNERVFKNSDSDELNDVVEDWKLTSYNIRYFEDRIYSYKRENIRGKYYYVIRRKGKIDSKNRPVFLRDDKKEKSKKYIKKGLRLKSGDVPPDI